MKKLIMIAIVASSVLSVSAQKGTWYLGTSGMGVFSTEDGGIETGPMTGFNTGKFSNDDKVFNFGLAPEVGFFVSDDFAVGLGLYYTFSKYTYKADNIDADKFNSFGVNPYARYYFLNSGNFRMYGQLGLVYSSSKQDIDGAKATNYFEAAVRPGISYNISDNFAINATFGSLGYGQAKHDKDKVSAFELNLNMSTLLFGFTVSF